jgi:hypothetical protein
MQLELRMVIILCIVDIGYITNIHVGTVQSEK